MSVISKTEVTIISIGNGGFWLACDLIAANVFPDFKFIVCDSDDKELKEKAEKADESFLLDKNGDKVIAKSDLRSGVVEEIVAHSSQTVIICCTFGGLAGSLYAPLIALEAKIKGKFVCTICTMPFIFEGTRRALRASIAIKQTLVASNLLFLQNNNELEKIPYLPSLEMNKPIIDTVVDAVRKQSLRELSTTSQLEDIIPSKYQLPGEPLPKVYNNIYPEILDRERIEMFDSYSHTNL